MFREYKVEKITVVVCTAVIVGILCTSVWNIQQQLDREITENSKLRGIILNESTYCKALLADPAVAGIIASQWHVRKMVRP